MHDIRIQSRETLNAAANLLAGELVEENTLKAQQTEKINAVKRRCKVDIDLVRKSVNSLKGKIKRFLAKDAAKAFDGKETGTIKTNLATVSVAHNPPAIVQLDKQTPEEALCAHAKACGFPEVVVTKEVINKDVLHTLTDNELNRLGFERVQDKTLTIRLNANPELKATAKI